MLRLLQMTAYLHVPRTESAASCCSPHKVCRLLYKCDDVETVGRMEWLALELVMEARHVLLERWGNADCALWSMLDDQFKCSRRDLHLSFAFSPHKMRLTGGELESAAPGAGERADVLLLAWPSQAEEPTVLGWLGVSHDECSSWDFFQSQ